MNLRIKILPIFLSVTIFLYVFIQSSFVSSASYSTMVLFDKWMEKTQAEREDIISNLLEEMIATGSFISSSLGAIVNGHDFNQFMKNYEEYKNYVLTDGVIVSPDDGKITISDDLLSIIKQALIEYNEEICGYRLYATTNYNSLLPSDFPKTETYATFRNIVSEAGVCVVGREIHDNGALYLYLPFSDADAPVGLVAGTDYGRGINNCLFYDMSSFRLKKFPRITFSCSQEMYHISDGVTSTSVAANSGLIGLNKTNLGSISFTSAIIYSTTGERLRVYNSLASLQNSSAGYRPVYFGSGFYGDAGELTVSFDKLQDYLDGKYDSYFDDLKDILDGKEDGMSEKEIEKIVDGLIDKMGEVGGKVDNVDSSLKETNSILSRILDRLGDVLDSLEGLGDSVTGALESLEGTLDGYLSDILLQLDYIALELEDMPENVVSEKGDSMISQLSEAFSEIGAAMSHKFPFSIPWDIRDLFVTLNGGEEPGTAYLASCFSLYGDDEPGGGGSKFIDVVVYSGGAGSGAVPLVNFPSHDDDLVMGGGTPAPSGGVVSSDSGAPVFTIPLVIASAGISSALIIDMSYFDILSRLSRSTFLLIFMYQLFLLSIKVFDFVKEMTD